MLIGTHYLSDLPPRAGHSLNLITEFSEPIMRPISQTTLHSSSVPVPTTITIIDNNADTEAMKKAAAAERLSELIQESGLEVMYTEEEYLQLDENDDDRNPLNDFLILRKIPEANSFSQNAIIQTLTKAGNVAALSLADHIIKENGADELNYLASDESRVVALEWLLIKNPSITQLTLTVGPNAGDLYDTLKKSASLQQINFLFLAPFDEDEAKNSLAQLAERNNLQKLSITMHKKTVSEDSLVPATIINLGLYKILDANPELESIDLNAWFADEEITSILASMQNMKNLTSVRFGNNVSIIPGFLEGIPKALSACMQLKKLEINGYPYEYTKQENLLDCLINHRNIRHLNFEFQLHSAFAFADNPAGNQRLRAALIEHPTLVSLDLSQRFITEDQLEVLLSGDASRRSLHSLKFSLMYIGTHTAQFIAQFLMTSPKLEEIKITTGIIDIEDFNIIANAIGQNKYLTKFEFKLSGAPHGRILQIEKIYEEKIQPKLDHNIRQTQAWGMRDKWGPAFGAFVNAPATAIPAEAAGILAQQLSRTEQAIAPLGAAQRTDRTMMEILLAMDEAARTEQKATPTPTPTPAPNPAPSPDSSSSSSSSASALASSSASTTSAGNSEQSPR